MRCSVCKSELVVGGQKHLETLCEHVFAPNDMPCLKDYYLCSNPDCDCAKIGVMWDQWGAFYSGHSYMDALKLQHIDNNNGAFDSFERKLNIESGKEDENSSYALPFQWRLYLIYKYKADEEGNILSRKKTFSLSHKGYHYIPGIHMLIFCIKSHYDDILRTGKIKDDFKWPKHNMKKDWWRWVSVFILRIIDRKTFKKV